MSKYKDQKQQLYEDCLRRLEDGLGETLKDHPKTTGKKPYLPTRIIETIWRGIHADLYPQQNWAYFRGTTLYGAFAAGRDWAKQNN